MAAAAGRACRSIARSATTTWCSRAAAVRDRSPGRGGAPNPTEGERVFRDTCAQCHRFGTLGKDYAPDLTKVADRLPRRDILRSIFFPHEKVDPKYATTVLATKDGKTIRGLVVSETRQTVVR